jgi:hypothetical protein
MKNDDDLQREIDKLLHQLEAPPPAAESAAERRARELAKQALDQKIREWTEEAAKALRDSKT